MRIEADAGRSPHTTMTPAWSVGAWPPVLWQPDSGSPLHFVHLGTHVSARFDSSWPNLGQTVWGGRAGDSSAGISWDWIEIAAGVIAVADPMTLVTNLCLLGPEGEVMTAHEAAPHLNRIVHRLQWQSEVRRALDELQRGRGLAEAPMATAERRSGSHRGRVIDASPAG